MLSEPKVVEREEQPYLGIAGSVRMGEIGPFMEVALPELFAWLGGKGIAPVGAPFMRYNILEMELGLELEVGVPIAATVPGDGRIEAGVLPAGRYGSLIYTGDYDGLVEANESLQRWARDNGLDWAMLETDRGDRFACRLEVYMTDPTSEPDPARWQTEITYLLADD